MSTEKMCVLPDAAMLVAAAKEISALSTTTGVSVPLGRPAVSNVLQTSLNPKLRELGDAIADSRGLTNREMMFNAISLLAKGPHDEQSVDSMLHLLNAVLPALKAVAPWLEPTDTASSRWVLEHEAGRPIPSDQLQALLAVRRAEEVTGKRVALLTDNLELINLAVVCGVGYGASFLPGGPERPIQFQRRTPTADDVGRTRTHAPTA